ncbi:unnamed protein product [Alternaria alternata]
MDSSSDTHKRPRFDFEKCVTTNVEGKHTKAPASRYSNSKVLSDVTIRYGASGELKFEAHRLLLSAQSRWFEAAFTGGFAESHAREITLVGDDPYALRIMLGFAYDQQIHPWESPLIGTTANIKRLLEPYRVGDKYQFPAFLVPVASWLGNCMDAWMNGSFEPVVEEFCGFVRDIYELVGSKHRPSHPLVQILLEIATEWGLASVLENTGGNQPLIVMASQKVAEFGRDIFLQLMGKTGSLEVEDEDEVEVITYELCIGVKLECSSCPTPYHVSPRSLQAMCPDCEQALGYWREDDD